MATTVARQRDFPKTRRALLDAARNQVEQHGVSVSLDVISRSSGVSKGGLLHHFPSKEALLVAVGQDLYERFESEVARLVESEPAGQGRLIRAYLKAIFQELCQPELRSKHAVLLNLIWSVPAVGSFVGDRLRQWNVEMSSDGIAPEVVRLVMLAADGAAVASLTGPHQSVAELKDLEAQLLALIENHRSIADSLPSATAKEPPL